MTSEHTDIGTLPFLSTLIVLRCPWAKVDHVHLDVTRCHRAAVSCCRVSVEPGPRKLGGRPRASARAADSEHVIMAVTGDRIAPSGTPDREGGPTAVELRVPARCREVLLER
jgi:hypothetical protein